jgi:hypothetical protein
MTHVANEISHAYPTLATELFSLSEDHVSDSQLMAELASHVLDLFEAGRIEEVGAAFELAEHLIVSGQDADRHVAIVGFLETVQNVASHRTCGISAFEQFPGGAISNGLLRFESKDYVVEDATSLFFRI